MGIRLLALALRHRGIVTGVLVFGFVLNLLVIGSIDPPTDPLERDLPMAAQCQGGGAGCAEQPLIPPPAVGMPRIDINTPIAFGVPVLVREAPPASLDEVVPFVPERPPLSTLAA